MPSTCEYCHGVSGDEATRCENCGAPIIPTSATADFRHCPFCSRALLAMGSPACSYCGKRLPESFLKARDADLHRIEQVSGEHHLPEGEKEKLAGLVGNSVLRHHDRDDTPVSDLVSIVSELFR